RSYWIPHNPPPALAGYLAAMEGDPPTAEFIEAVARRNSLPLECFSNFVYHARIDPQHRRDLDAVLDALPLTGDHLALIGLSSLRTIGMMTGIMEGIINASH